MKRNFLLAAAAGVALSAFAMASAASAADSWTGFYVGASAGVLSASTRSTDSDDAYGYKLQSEGGGALGGVTVGYNYQLQGPWVVGLEADYSLAAAGNSGSAVYGVNAQGTDVESLGTVRGRIGYAVDKNLYYATAGAAFGEVKSHGTDYYVNDSDYYAETSKMQSGWTIGAGYERAIGSNVSLKFEALYADLGSEHATNFYGYVLTFRTTTAAARAGVNFKF